VLFQHLWLWRSGSATSTAPWYVPRMRELRPAVEVRTCWPRGRLRRSVGHVAVAPARTWPRSRKHLSVQVHKGASRLRAAPGSQFVQAPPLAALGSPAVSVFPFGATKLLVSPLVFVSLSCQSRWQLLAALGTVGSCSVCKQRRLTPRSRRGPTAGHQARQLARLIIQPPGLASHRQSRLTSNVRRRKAPPSVCPRPKTTRCRCKLRT
jgi:hypothetical protein